LITNCHRPVHLEKALDLRGADGPKKLVVAGGTDLMVRLQEVDPEVEIELLLLEGIRELEEISWNEKNIILGAGVKVETIARDEKIFKTFPGLKEAAEQLGSWQVRNLATLGGNICNAAPSGDLLPPLIVYDAKLELTSSKGNRVLPAEDFFLGPGMIDLKEDELLTRILIPLPEKGSGSRYEKFGIREAMEIAIVGVGVGVVLGKEGKVEKARIALGAVAPTPIRVPEGEKIAIGSTLEDNQIKEIIRSAKETARPICDIRSSENYREDLVGILLGRALKKAKERALKKGWGKCK